jgi:hypothetical protein
VPSPKLVPLVLSDAERASLEALSRKRTAPCLPMLPTTPARMTHDYVRNGTTSLFAALDLASGSVIAQPYRRHRHQESRGSSGSSTPPSPTAWNCTWCSITTPRTRPPRSTSGC